MQLNAQDTLTVSGNVYDYDNSFVHMNFFAVNKRTGKGEFGNYKGLFTMKVLRKDTIIISAKDYHTLKLVVRDSCSKSCKLRIALHRKEVQLITVDIFPTRNHDDITKDLKKLKDPKDIEKVTADPINSPITALYQAFSKIERSKYKVAVMEAEDRKKDVLKELLSKYVKAEIIDLDEEKFDDFLSVADFQVNYLRTLSDYHLIKYVQYRYESYKMFNDFYNVIKRLYKNQYEFVLLEARGEKQTVVKSVLAQYVDKAIWEMCDRQPEFLFDFLNYAQFNTTELVEMSDYGIIATVNRKYDKFITQYGYKRR